MSTAPLPHDPAIEHRDWPTTWQGLFLEHLARNPIVAAAARYAGISREHAYRVRRGDDTFAQAWDEAVEVGKFVPLQIAYQRATTGQSRTVTTTRRRFDVTDGHRTIVEESETVEQSTLYSNGLLMRMLEAWFPEFQRKAKHEHAGPGGGAIPVEHTVMRPLDPARALELARIAQQHADTHGIVEGSASPAELPPSP